MGFIIDSSNKYLFEHDSLIINLGKRHVKDGDTIHAEIYCYTSEDFNGDSVNLVISGGVNNNSTSFYRMTFAKPDTSHQPKNLIYNGDFKLGKRYWSSSSDSTFHSIITTPYGRGIRISRGNGDGKNWALKYDGKPIIYYKDHTYQIRFLFKVHKGNGIPFSVGWWVDLPQRAYSLPLKTMQLQDGWIEASCSYKFKETVQNPYTLLNGLNNNSVVDIAKVEITDLDNSGKELYFLDDFLKKGKWQLVSLDVPCKKGKASCKLVITLDNKKRAASSFKGKVVFALPQITLTNRSN
jgi:hypothetical protein